MCIPLCAEIPNASALPDLVPAAPVLQEEAVRITLILQS
jgi:hypothetical protein